MGSWFVIGGAAAAARTISPRIEMPATKLGVRYQRRRNPCRCSMIWASATTSAATAINASSSVEPHPRVEQRVDDVGREVDQHDHHREDECHRLHDGEVALEDRVDHQLADARHREDLLDHERAPDQEADVDAEDGHG